MRFIPETEDGVDLVQTWSCVTRLANDHQSNRTLLEIVFEIGMMIRGRCISIWLCFEKLTPLTMMAVVIYYNGFKNLTCRNENERQQRQNKIYGWPCLGFSTSKKNLNFLKKNLMIFNFPRFKRHAFSSADIVKSVPSTPFNW